MDLTGNSSSKCSLLKGSFSFIVLLTQLEVLATTCYPVVQKNQIAYVCFFKPKFSLILVNLELFCEMTKLNQKILVHLAECVSAETFLAQ